MSKLSAEKETGLVPPSRRRSGRTGRVVSQGPAHAIALRLRHRCPSHRPLRDCHQSDIDAAGATADVEDGLSRQVVSATNRATSASPPGDRNPSPRRPAGFGSACRRTVRLRHASQPSCCQTGLPLKSVSKTRVSEISSAGHAKMSRSSTMRSAEKSRHHRPVKSPRQQAAVHLRYSQAPPLPPSAFPAAGIPLASRRPCVPGGPRRFR